MILSRLLCWWSGHLFKPREPKPKQCLSCGWWLR